MKEADSGLNIRELTDAEIDAVFGGSSCEHHGDHDHHDHDNGGSGCGGTGGVVGQTHQA